MQPKVTEEKGLAELIKNADFKISCELLSDNKEEIKNFDRVIEATMSITFREIIEAFRIK